MDSFNLPKNKYMLDFTPVDNLIGTQFTLVNYE